MHDPKNKQKIYLEIGYEEVQLFKLKLFYKTIWVHSLNGRGVRKIKM